MVTRRIVDTLDVYISGTRAGELHQLKDGKLSFSYSDQWMSAQTAIPLSLSMPAITQTYHDKVVAPFLWGLLPDNEQILARWGQRFQVSARNSFALLKNVGRDCAGAVQFLPQGIEPSREEAVEPLTDKQIGNRLRDLRQDAGATRRIGDAGQFSLAGAQAKTAFHLDKVTGQWSIPLGDTPTTHIFKPPMSHLQGHTENEHFCLQLARMFGMDAAHSAVREFDGEKAIVVERYDRLEIDGRTIRLHQEDMCQALSVMPTRKYENQGGPGIARISVDVLAASTDPIKDREAFMAANIFNWIIGNTDAHAKNFSMLLGAQGDARFAPLYDISSILPHLGEGEVPPATRGLRLAMKIDAVYPMEEVMPRHWERCAATARISREFTMETIRRQISALPDAASDCAKRIKAEGISHAILGRLVDTLALRARDLARFYG